MTESLAEVREETAGGGFAERAGQALRAAAALVAALYVACALIQAGARVVYPYQLDYYEGELLDYAHDFARGRLPWAATTTPPWSVHNYGPVYPALWGEVMALGRPESFWPGRLVAVAGLLLAALCLALLVRRFSGQWLPALVAAGVFLWFPAVRGWTALARVDTLGVGLTLAGFTVFLLGSPRARVWGTLLFVLAVGTKQTMLAAPVAAYAALWLQGERRSAALHLALFLGLILATCAVLQVVSHGGFARDTILANMNKWDATQARHYLGGFLSTGPILLGVALAGGLVALGAPKYRALGLYLFLAMAGTATVGKIGARPNYFVEPTAVAAVFLGLALAHSSRLPRGLALGATLLPALALTQLVLQWMPPSLGPPRSQRAADADLVALVRAQPGEVLSEHLGAVVQAGKTLWTEPSVTSAMTEEGHWDQAPLLQLIRERKFSLIVKLSRGTGTLASEWWDPADWTPEEVQAIVANYHLRGVAGRPTPAEAAYGLLVPNSPASAP